MNMKKLKLYLAMLLLGIAAANLFAGEAAPKPTPESVQIGLDTLTNNLNIAWTCLTAFLVFFMQAGFAMVETGFTRAKNACNIMMKNLMDFCLGSIAFFLLGFGFMFGGGSELIGLNHFASTDFSASSLNWSFWMFQCVFAATAATIVSGAMAERTKFVSYLIYSALVSAFIYPIAGHWMWGNLFGVGTGWLAKMGFVDFAGSTVVHSCGGWLALAGAIVLGPRIGKYTPEGKAKPICGHSITLAALGVFILWFGWFGFNPGSTTAAIPSIGYIAMTTNMAAAAGAIGAMFTAWARFRKPDASMSLNGVLAGLVAITAGCNDVTIWGALIIGLLAGILVVLSVEFIDKVLHIDDPVGAVSVHGVCGFFGTIMLSFFLKEGSSASFGVQLLGAATQFVWAFGTGMILFIILKHTVGLRVSREEEMRGLDISEHGNEAYSGFQIFTNE